MLAPNQLHELAHTLQAHPPTSPLWTGLIALLDDTIKDANDNSTHAATPPDERPWWAGHERGLRDFKQDLEDLRSGAYRLWPMMPPEKEGEEISDL